MRAARRRSQAAQTSIPAPIQGIVENDPAGANRTRAAEYIENFLPTLRGLRVRGGTVEHANVGSAVQSLFTYVSGLSEQLFASTATAFFNVTSSAGEDTEIVSGLTGGYWSTQQMGTSGGEFLVAVSGSDFAQIYNGTAWFPWVGEAVNELPYDGLTDDFLIGETVTGGTSGASALIVGLARTTATTGKIFVGAVTSGPFQDNEALTSASGAADASGANSVASSLTVTGVATNKFNHVWSHQNRLFFIEEDSMKVWYLPAGAVGGAANDLNLRGVFQRGGNLLFGATWSLDSGAGLDDKCVFVSTQGEVAIYSGTDPSSASTWRLEGRYDIGRPLSRQGFIRVGGDILIATDDGIVPLSSALSKDAADLSLAAVTRPIRNIWASEVNRGFANMELLKWTTGEVMLTLFPESSRSLSANLQTTAWAVQTGWSGSCGAELAGNAYIGQADGIVKQIDTTGADMGTPFTAKVCGSFSDMGDPIRYKSSTMMRGAYFADVPFSAKYSVALEYNVNFPAAPAVVASSTDGLIWGTDNWNEATWGEEVETASTGFTDFWKSVTGFGYALAPVVQITSGNAQKMPVELVRIDMIAEGGGRAA